jgi:DNA-3-methyladenine glycosylase II
MFLLFHLGRLDVFAPGDLGLREGIRILDSLEARPVPADAEARARVWRPLRSVASWVLWRLADRGGMTR